MTQEVETTPGIQTELPPEGADAPEPEVINDDAEPHETLLDKLPGFLAIVVLSAALSLGAGWALNRAGATAIGSPHVVTFDAVKFANAQRAIAAGLLGPQGKDNSGDIAVELMHVSKQAEATIAKVAGPGTVVIVKQAVVSGQVPDITDKVLAALGLPTNVPSVDPSRYIFDEAPTDLSFTMLRGQADAHTQHMIDKAGALQKAQKAAAEKGLVP